MICTDALTGLLKGCENNLGSIKAAYIADETDVGVITEAAGSVSAITMIASAVFKPYEFRKNTGNFTEDSAIDLNNGSTLFNQVINLVFHRREAAKSQEIQILAQGQRNLTAILKDGNDKFWVFSGMQLATVGEGSGTAKADGSKYALSFTAESDVMAFETTQAVLDTVI